MIIGETDGAEGFEGLADSRIFRVSRGTSEVDGRASLA